MGECMPLIKGTLRILRSYLENLTDSPPSMWTHTLTEGHAWILCRTHHRPATPPKPAVANRGRT